MNQNMPRQITQEEINQQLSKEELHKTQVLNLKEVEAVARFEKRTSKKPAIIIAVIGIMSIFFGTTFSIVQSFNSKNKSSVEPRKETTPQKQEQIIVNDETTVNCIVDTLNNPDGTDTSYTIQMNFKNDKLISFTKHYIISAIDGNATGAKTIKTYEEGYKAFLNSIPGYDIDVTTNNNMVNVLVSVSYEMLDLSLLSPVQANHFSTAIDFPKDTLKSVIVDDYTSKGLTCN